MSLDSSYFRFPNCSCKKCIVFYFQDKCICKPCGHVIDLHSYSANYIDNSVFATSLQALTPQYSFSTADSNSENTTQGLPTPNNNFLLMTPGATSETTVCS